MALKLGVHTGQQDVELDELRRLWRYIDSHGWDFISIWDHFYEAPPSPAARSHCGLTPTGHIIR